MKKSKYLALFAVAFVVGITGCKVESEKHEHTFSKEWTSNEIAHWHEATCEHKTETSGMAAHTFGEWKVTEKATESQEGERERICSVCNYAEKETIAKLEHVHTFGSLTVKKEATELEDGYGERTCSACGYVEQVPIYALNHTHKFATEWTSDETDHWHIAICGHTEVSGKELHQWNSGEITKNATCTENGEKTYTCTVCGKIKAEIETIPPTGHSFSTEWKNDTINHWHVPTCGDTEEISDVAEHTFGEWRVIKVPTETENGERERICSICNYVYKEVISSILGTLIRVEGREIKGTETWIPKSDVFYEARDNFTILDLYVSDHEVTRKENKDVMGDDPSVGKAFDADGNELTGDNVLNNPVNYVSFFDALSYCNKLSKSEGLAPCYKLNESDDPNKLKELNNYDFKNSTQEIGIYCDFNKNGYRLPTVEEWEFLARGDKEEYQYPGSNVSTEVIALIRTETVGSVITYAGTTIIRSKKPNKYKLYDMCGNVSEYCWGGFNIKADTNNYGRFLNLKNQKDVPVRGGPFTGIPSAQNGKGVTSMSYMSVTNGSPPYSYNRAVGFRVVRTVTE